MNSSAADESVRTLVDRVIKDTSHTIAASGRWLYVLNSGTALPEHGWKLHVSARPATLHTTLAAALPILVDAPCSFKVVADSAGLAALNSFENPNPGSAGKAITVYPDQTSPARITELAGLLADAVSGMAAPTVRSDRRVRPDAPVYYRYGPFRPRYRTDSRGQVVLMMRGPSGEEFPGQAGGEYQCPPWADDPFTSATSTSEPSERTAAHTLLGNRYELHSGIQRHARGAVYRARDTRNGDPVIVKHAYPWIGENSEGIDTRVHLRNERHILSILEDTSVVPRVIDHFHHEADEFLVISDLGGRTLSDDVAEHGLYVNPRDRGPHLVPRQDGATLDALATRLATLLEQAHERGVVVRDLTPNNILHTDDQRLRLIDFEISFHSGPHVHGFTAAYASPEQCSGQRASFEDDYYALGATLFFAATGMTPVVAADGQRPCPDRTVDCLTDLYPCLVDGSARGTVACVPELLSGDPERRRHAAAIVRSGFDSAPRIDLSTRPTPEWEPHAEQRRLLRELHDWVAELDDSADAIPLPHCVHSGTSGTALELLRHSDATARRAATRLFQHTRHNVDRVGPPTPGLMFGSTGTAVALATYAASTGTEPAESERSLDAVGRMAPPDPACLGERISDDYTHGLAGVGIGHLLLARLTGQQRHLDVAAACATRLLTGDCTRAADSVDEEQPHTGASVEHGFAHGTAGLVGFLLEYRKTCGPTGEVDAALAKWCQQLVEQIHVSLSATRTPYVRPMVVSWCQGLAGMGAAVLRAGRLLDVPDYVDLARQSADAAMRVAGRVVATDQCCGLAGLGDFVLDLAMADPQHREHWLAGAQRVADVLLTRSPSPGREPELVRPGSPTHDQPQRCWWGTGDAGRLAFLRRLHDGGSRAWPLP